MWKKEQEKNKNLPKEKRVKKKATSYDAVVKRALKIRKIPFKSVVTQQARINFLKAVNKYFSKDVIGYYISFNIEFKKEIDLNGYNIAVSQPINNTHLIDNAANDRKMIQKARMIKLLQKKQSRRVRKGNAGKNFKKTQKKLNKKYKKLTNQKSDLYHKISKTLTDKFELIAVEELKVKNMFKSAKENEINSGKNVKAKSGLNKTILNASFYLFQSMLQYKTKLNGKLFVKVNPQYTSLDCSKCGNRDKNNRPRQDYFKCTKCGYETNPDIQASQNILKRALKSLGVGITPMDLKQKAFRSFSLESVS